MFLTEFIQSMQFVRFKPMDICVDLNLFYEVLNTVLAPEYEYLRSRAMPLADIQRMSTFPIAAILAVIIKHLPPGQIYLNIGVWYGFTLFAGMLLEPQGACVGVDNFSQFGGPRAQFYQDFERFQTGPHQRFYEMDYQDYFQRHAEPIGLYFYDGAHDYASQYQALVLAEPWLAPGAFILVDDTNLEAPRQATIDFVRNYPGYRFLGDLPTCMTGHPTFWNGLLILQKDP
jgi:hypothetical protein